METRSIWAVGRNYAAHAREMKSEIPVTPMFFLKSGSTLTPGGSIPLPNFSQDIHHELELAVQLDTQLKPARMALALDLTARDVQSAAKSKGLPWTLAKSFQHSCPIGPWLPFCGFDSFQKLEFELSVNGTVRQKGDASDMVFPLTALLEFLQVHFSLSPGDIILTGTPEGVAQLKPHDHAEARWMLNGQALPPVNWQFS